MAAFAHKSHFNSTAHTPQFCNIPQYFSSINWNFISQQHVYTKRATIVSVASCDFEDYLLKNKRSEEIKFNKLMEIKPVSIRGRSSSCRVRYVEIERCIISRVSRFSIYTHTARARAMICLLLCRELK
jgi:hypothetical protein